MRRMKPYAVGIVLMMSAALLLSQIVAVPAQGSDTRGLQVVALTESGRLMSFTAASGRSERTPGNPVSGLVGDVRLVGIDFRVQDGKLYGVGNAGGVYLLDASTALATKVSQLTVALSGTNFGVDFNPAADRLRIISNTGQNLRHNVNAGGATVSDGALTYTPPSTATGVAGAAYTNNDLDPNTATTLYALDSSLDQLVIQAPPNNGNLNAVGKLLVDTSAVVGFDIFSRRDANGSATDAQALASVTVGGAVQLHSINLLTGRASLIASLGSDDRVVDIAVPLDQP